MGRRWGGLLIVVLVLLAAAVVPNLRTKAIAGKAELGPIPGPPAVGDCVTGSVVDSTWTIRDSKPEYQHIRTGPCAASRMGEVVAVIPRGLDVAILPHTDPDGTYWTDNPNLTTCDEAAARYVGTTSTHQLPGFGQWSPAWYLNTVAGRPDDLQVAFGARWLVCIGFFGDWNTGASVAYSVSARNSLSAGRPPRQAAQCSATPTENVSPAGCQVGHTVEYFGWAPAQIGRTTQAELDTGCLALVKRFTGMPDPTAGGTLRVVARATHYVDNKEVTGLGPAGDDTGSARCLVQVVGPRTLVGSLLQLGTGPVPWR